MKGQEKELINNLIVEGLPLSVQGTTSPNLRDAKSHNRVHRHREFGQAITVTIIIIM